MHIFIDESGNFSGYHAVSISAVGALAIPDSKLRYVTRKYQKIRTRLPLESGEVKGRLLNEKQINEIVDLLASSEVLFEISVVDMGLHTEDEILAEKKEHARYTLESVQRFRESVRPDVEKASHQISETSVPLYLQAITTFDLLHRLISHVPLYYVQRKPSELGSFTWIIDGKDPHKITNWEAWWSWYAHGALATMSKHRPAPVLSEGADYSFYDRFNCTVNEDGSEEGTDVKLLLKDLRFSSSAEPGLELIDILVNATRRALMGNLQKEGWQNIRRLMVHRKENYIGFLAIGGQHSGYKEVQVPYAEIARHFCHGGKSMMTPEMHRLAKESKD